MKYKQTPLVGEESVETLGRYGMADTPEDSAGFDPATVRIENPTITN
jgi:hypothetical protein